MLKDYNEVTLVRLELFIKFKDEYLLHKDSIKCVHSLGNYGNPSIQLKQDI